MGAPRVSGHCVLLPATVSLSLKPFAGSAAGLAGNTELLNGSRQN